MATIFTGDALRPPLPEQIGISESLKDWLEPHGRSMRQRNLQDIRRDVARDLAQRMGGKRHEANILLWLNLWADNRTNPTWKKRNGYIVALQLEARELFGGDINHLKNDAARLDVQATRQKEGEFLRELLLAMYEESQQQLRERGIESVTLWRGEAGIFNPSQKADFDIGRLPFQPLNSFTYQLARAFSFIDEQEGALIAVSAPASRILATPATGFGVLNQREEVLFAIPNSANIIDEGFIAQWRSFELWQDISTLRERDWAEVLEDFYKSRD